MKPQNKKGFTLIELMIVVAIIWVLAVTIVPALTWAQARARDAGRVASLQNISAVLETYFSDQWEYPTDFITTGTPTPTDTWNSHCISTTWWNTAWNIKIMFKWWAVPLNPQKASKSWWCNLAWVYWYDILEKNGISNSSYLLISDLENFQKANLNLATTTWATAIAAAPAITLTAQSTYEAYVKVDTTILWKPNYSVEAWLATNSVYWMSN